MNPKINKRLNVSIFIAYIYSCCLLFIFTSGYFSSAFSIKASSRKYGHIVVEGPLVLGIAVQSSVHIVSPTLGKGIAGWRSDVPTLSSVVPRTTALLDTIVMLMRCCTLLNLMLTSFFGANFSWSLVCGKIFQRGPRRRAVGVCVGVFGGGGWGYGGE